MTQREKRTRDLIKSIDLDELMFLSYYCLPDKILLAEKKYGFRPIKKLVDEAIAEAILLEF